MRLRTLSLLLTLCVAVPASLAPAQEYRRGEIRRIPESYPYRLEKIEMPQGLLAENGGISFLPDGRLVAVFHHGEVMIYDPPTKKWSVFATGLHDPLGVVAISDREMIVGQRPEITRVKDTDGDGKADTFETISDEFGMSGNYSEFTHGPIMDAEGNLYFSLNTASNNGPVRPIIRGDYSPRGRIGRMFSAVPYRGWVLKITPDGKTIPWASGFRSPNGLTLDREGNLYVTDNQGDWLGTSKLFLVHPGEWHGHVPSLAWEPGINGNPFTIPVPVLDRMRVKEIVQIPQSILANSPTQPLIDMTGGKFGPFAGQMFIGELNHATLMRVMLEEVNHQMQGAVVPFLNGDPLRQGGNRLAFAPDGSLWMGHTDHGWGGDAGITRIVWNGQMPMDVYTMSLTPTGFDLTFTKPVDRTLAANPEAYKFQRYFYEYSINYGSPQKDKSEVKVTEARVSADGKRVSLTLAELKPGYVHQVDLPTIKAADGTELVNSTVYYTLNQLRQNGPASPALSAATR
jgi:glucose/arabinose dehydrogenase